MNRFEAPRRRDVRESTDSFEGARVMFHSGDRARRRIIAGLPVTLRTGRPEARNRLQTYSLTALPIPMP